MPVSAEEARELARSFLQLSHQLGEWRFAHWGQLAAAERQEIEDAEWDLLNYANGFVTSAVGLALADMEGDLARIREATARAKRVIAARGAVAGVLRVTAALVTLGAALAAGAPEAIARAAVAAVKAGE